ncbi:MAG: 16S rRNA (adenine(1518)-N(6)/adenine(1519)-N(6))-dimethyltransferase [Clostridiales bacterium]|nr:MAG: 16S rRNA (adenine(1518)-N(6)/adenine(1519)-N(6))-dimethyltransferase [Clostridiales bacterium]
MNISEDLKKEKFRFKKQFGQNFISDDHLLAKIVEAAEITPEDVVIEIGPGAATLTAALAEKAAQVIAIEIDKDLFPIIERRMAGYSNFELVAGDAMKVDFDALAAKYGAKRYKVVANLPYYITTPIVMRFLEEGFRVSELVIMVQQEVADRFLANPGTKAYGAITAAINYYGSVSRAFNVPRTMFTPRPEVDSSIVKIKCYENKPFEADDEKLLRRVIKAAFGQRRKTLNNALKALNLPKDELDKALQRAGIDAARRGETLSVEEFVCLSNAISKISK